VRRWGHHHDGGPLNAGRPSAVSRDRLAERVRGDVAEVRTRLEEAILRGDVYLAAGQPERAAAVVDEQQALMAELRTQVEASVAAAVVEAEAESVLSAGPDGEAIFGAPSDERSGDAAGLRRRGVRGAASAVVSAAAALAFLVMVSSPPGPQTLAAAGVDDQARPDDDAGDAVPGRNALTPSDAPGSTRPGAGTDDGDGGDGSAAPDATRRGSRSVPDGDGVVAGGPDLDLSESLSELQALVDRLRDSVMQAAEAGLDRLRQRSDDTVGEGQQPADDGSVPGSGDDDRTVPGPGSDPEQDATDGHTAGDDPAAEPTDEPTEGSDPDGTGPGHDDTDDRSTDGDTGGEDTDTGEAEDADGDEQFPTPGEIEEGVSHNGLSGH
jgi:hypothetical protein